ncbi:MAG: malto-oligosyltrehalose synthase, partial [Actinomycetota bacterium]|nr:malto-oligosyltrehalose synthase [Actinomycetota bacterium]
ILERVLREDVDLRALLADWQSGAVKQLLVARTLGLRREWPELFTTGAYQPLSIEGASADRMVAFARTHEGTTAVIVAPRLVAPLLEGAELPLPPAAAWADTRVLLPEEWADGSLSNVLTRRKHAPSGKHIVVADLLADLPLALLLRRAG